jgi:hypothetical protein
MKLRQFFFGSRNTPADKRKNARFSDPILVSLTAATLSFYLFEFKGEINFTTFFFFPFYWFLHYSAIEWVASIFYMMADYTHDHFFGPDAERMSEDQAKVYATIVLVIIYIHAILFFLLKKCASTYYW